MLFVQIFQTSKENVDIIVYLSGVPIICEYIILLCTASEITVSGMVDVFVVTVNVVVVGGFTVNISFTIAEIIFRTGTIIIL